MDAKKERSFFAFCVRICASVSEKFSDSSKSLYLRFLLRRVSREMS